MFNDVPETSEEYQQVLKSAGKLSITGIEAALDGDDSVLKLSACCILLDCMMEWKNHLQHVDSDKYYSELSPTFRAIVDEETKLELEKALNESRQSNQPIDGQAPAT